LSLPFHRLFAFHVFLLVTTGAILGQ
jgi:hypothetical protein